MHHEETPTWRTKDPMTLQMMGNVAGALINSTACEPTVGISVSYLTPSFMIQCVHHGLGVLYKDVHVVHVVYV